MSPVHVIVGEDPRAEAMWARSFAGAVDLYRFPRNVDAFERLTAAEAPIDLVILTPAQQGPFNLTPDQFVARVLEGPLGSSRCLANLHVVVVGAPLRRSHPRAMSVSTLDAAVRLVKFGEVEQAPMPAPSQAPAVSAAPATASHAEVDALIADLPFSGSVISRIWDAPAPTRDADVVPTRGQVVVGGGPAAQDPRRVAAPAPVPMVAGTPAQPQLFAKATAPEFVAPVAAPASVMGGGASLPVVGAPGESIEVGSALQPARPYSLPNGAGYRGPVLQAGRVHGAGHPAGDLGGQPVPPALGSQVHAMVYGPGVGQPNDPLLVWTSSARAASVPAPAPAAAVPAPVQTPQPQAVAAQVIPTVPMQPPAGAYGAAPMAAAPVAPAPAPAPAVAVDPFLARAEQDGGSVAFG